MATFLIIATIVNFLWSLSNSHKLKKETAGIAAMCAAIDEKFNALETSNEALQETNSELQESQATQEKAINHCLKRLAEVY